MNELEYWYAILAKYRVESLERKTGLSDDLIHRVIALANVNIAYLTGKKK